MTYQVAVCDDDIEFARCFSGRIQDAFAAMGVKAQIECFEDGETCCQAVKKREYDLIFMDIEMDSMNGFDAARQICFYKERRELPYLIFVSAHESMVFDSYEFEPLWFLCKERLEELGRALRKFAGKMEARELTFSFREGRSFRSVKIREILYLEGRGHWIDVNTWSDRFDIYGSLGQFEKELTPHGFFRIHRNFLVNMAAVFSINKDTVTLVDYTSLPMGRDRKARVREHFLTVNGR